MSQTLPRPREPAAGPRGERHILRGVLQSARPKQWVKNLLVFAAPGAAGVLTHASALGRSAAAFLVFCALSSATYLLNDVVDAAADRIHPVKRRRPVASGALPVSWAIGAALALLTAGLAASVAVDRRLLAVSAIYLGVQVLYTLRLKHEAVFDLASVAAGFVLRAIAGGIAVGVGLSQWFLIVTTFGAMLMVTGKRFAEHQQLGEDRGAHRRALDAYNEPFLRGVMYLSTAVATVAYCLWAFEKQATMHIHTDGIFFELSIVPFVLGLLRYAHTVESGRGGQPEEVLFSDRALQLVAAFWVALFSLGVYAS